MFDGPDADEEASGDLTVGQAAGDQLGDFPLPGGQVAGCAR
jgi:hypothetical protein